MVRGQVSKTIVDIVHKLVYIYVFRQPEERFSTMKISAKTEYACIAMLDLASQHQSGQPVRIRDIADRHDVPPRFLVQILLQLKGAGLVASVRGAAGGYQLLVPPEEISLGRILGAIDGLGDDENQPTNASPDSPAVKVLLHAWREVAAAEHKVLDGTTLADLLERADALGESMYHI
jgi:Rrf2 family protein